MRTKDLSHAEELGTDLQDLLDLLPRVAPGKRTRAERLPARLSSELPSHSDHHSTPAPASSGFAGADPFGLHLPGAVQLRATGSATGDVHTAAASGLAEPSSSLPFLDEIQASFGPAHDVRRIEAHVGGAATAASAAMGASAYAAGEHVAFARAPDLHTAAHEAAHVVQQRAGVTLAGGVGAAGDTYERNADAVADAVVRGESAAALLGAPAAASADAAGSVQRREAGAANPTTDPVELGIAYLRQRWATYRSKHVLQLQLSYWANYYARMSNEALGREMESKASPALRHLGLRNLAISTVREEMAQDLHNDLALDPIEGARQLAQAESAGFGYIRTVEPSFEPEHARMIDAVATGFEERVHDRMRPILGRVKGGVDEATLQPIANQVTAEALAPFRSSIPVLTIAVRNAFHRAVKDIVASTGDHVIAICFIRAMTDVMGAHLDDFTLRQELVDRALDVQRALGSKKKQSAENTSEVITTVIAAESERTKLIGMDLLKNSVEIQYVKLYIALRQALQEVGDDWISASTKYLRDEAADASRDKLWISRGINMAWAFCPGPVAAVPTVLFGTISDIFSDALVSTIQSQVADRERALRAKLAELLRQRLSDIEEQAHEQFQKIDAGELQLLKTRTFLSIDAITAGYTSNLRQALKNS